MFDGPAYQPSEPKGFLIDVQELKAGLIIFRRADVKHRKWYCRVKIPRESRYKTISLGTADINEATEKAFDHDADIRFRVKHEVPIFEKTFAQVATEYSTHLRTLAQAGQITMSRWQVVDGYIRLHLVPFAGHLQIVHVTDKQWTEYPLWRKQNSQKAPRKSNGRHRTMPSNPSPVEGSPATDGTIRQEMMTFRAIMNFAAKKRHIRENQVPKGRLPTDRARREAFSPEEYRKLHTFARRWIKDGRGDSGLWYRKMAYHFMLIMTNTGMRTIEAENLLWRDIALRTDKQGRRFVVINVRGKDKFRELVAADNVANYLDRIREISKATGPDDFVFSNIKGKKSTTLYTLPIGDLLTKSGLLLGSSGSRRSSYCFRHTYATYRLTEGVDVYFLAKQMGTSVQMIEEYYGHITPAKNAERILQGVPGWEPIRHDAGEPASGVNAGASESKAKKQEAKEVASRSGSRSTRAAA